mmetsp:Transcript_36636/g.93340  ORF Transcript_36636/g.93340 Transcript_36636/m.93340 type:complete len:329 (-) Transcript_36636:154-1140(-)
MVAGAMPAPDVAPPAAEAASLTDVGDVAGRPTRQTTPPTSRRVRLQNVPVQPHEQLKTAVRAELARLWRVALSRPPPVVEDIHVAQAEGTRTYAQMLAGTEITVEFTEWEDASWLVDGRNARAWSQVLDVSIGSRILRVQWATCVPDWRRLTYEADADASSHMSYSTVGTKHSYTSKLLAKQRPAAVSTASTASGGSLPAAAAAAARPSAAAAQGQGQPLNRTVVLEGLPRTMPAHQVVDEVLKLLKNLWKRDGYSFAPEDQLHQGISGGIAVRQGRERRSGDEHDGTCLVKLRRHVDADWLVQGCAGRLSICGGTPLRASWARPRIG